MRFGRKDLKQTIRVTPTHVECPVLGCTISVPRQRRTFTRKAIFQCPEHRIFISPTTFEYDTESDNLIWIDNDDHELLAKIKQAKRESRLARDNSEDALTWNLFRYMEKTNQLPVWLTKISENEQTKSEIIYWSYSQIQKGSWLELNAARKEFGEHLKRSSEPDLIIASDKAIFFIEAKLTATNKTTPSRPTELKKYITGGNQWFREVFISDYNTIAIGQNKYELLRFWLLGTWLAKQLGKTFYLINLVPDLWEIDIEARFSPHIKAAQDRIFKRMTWEDVFRFALENGPATPEKELLKDYFENKTIGYDRFGILRPAFNQTA